MKRERIRVFLAIQAALCALVAVLLGASAVQICREGLARRAERPLAPIYTREIVAEKLAPIAPLIFASAGMTAAGLVLGVRDENADRPAREPRSLRETAARGEKARKMRAQRTEYPAAKPALQIALAVLAVGLIALGAYHGGAWDVLCKAISICTECVGLG